MKKWISKNIFHFSDLIIELKKDKRKKNCFWIYFDLKSISKNKNQNFRIHFLISNQKRNLKKLFYFSILVRFVFKSKNELYFRYTDYKTNWFFDFQNNRILKFKFEVCFSFFILIWKTKNQIYFNKYPIKLVTRSHYAITINTYNRIK